MRLQALGWEAGAAGNAVQITIFLGICVGYISTYIFRVANKVHRRPASALTACPAAHAAMIAVESPRVAAGCGDE